MVGRALFWLVAAGIGGCASHPSGAPVSLPDGEPGIGFDDLRYSAALGKVLAPAGRAGDLDLVDPLSLAVTRISGFTKTSSYDGGHDDGPTSVDEGAGFLFVTDRSAEQLAVVDPQSNAIVARVPLGASPDYVRFVGATRELWVTEPSASRLEILTITSDNPPTVTSSGTLSVDNGPESLVIDQRRGRAYTHRWQRTTVAIDVKTRVVIGEWPNGCAASRGIAVDEEHGFVFAACSEGTVTVMDAAGDGRILSSVAKGAGFDVMGYAPRLGHLYLAGSACKCLVVLGVSAAGALTFLGRFDAAASTHCAAADDHGQAWVCDQDAGRLWRVPDPWPATSGAR